ncbi:hypothetical protein [Cerasicoccus fimbriatus]|uniref:hypothetical protein n=1 Tax=Cerasicoccus fimbriatus TaxID=3014554 RepID=UPI0022B53388|nr:hypothetical protein [Cerasicoccus sp. TK19100]
MSGKYQKIADLGNEVIQLSAKIQSATRAFVFDPSEDTGQELNQVLAEYGERLEQFESQYDQALTVKVAETLKEQGESRETIRKAFRV